MDSESHVKKTSMIVVGAVLIVALLQGVDGTLLALGLAGIVGLGGYVLGRKQ